MGEVVGRGQNAAVLRQEAVATLVVRRVGVVDVEQAGDRLLLEPLSGVAGGDAGALGQLVWRQRPVASEGAVEAELGAEVDRVELERSEGGAEQALGERLGAVGNGGGHGGRSWGRGGQRTGAPARARLAPCGSTPWWAA